MSQMVPPWLAQQGAPMAPVQHQAPGAHMPSYLAVGEYMGEENSYMGTLGKEILRSFGKSGGHTLASFFDNNPFNRYPAPGEPGVEEDP